MILNTRINLPNEAIYFIYTKIILLIVFFSLVLSLINKNFIGSFIGLIFLVGGPFFLYFYMVFKSTSLIIDENKLTINSGIIIKSSKSIALSNIQDANTSRGPISSLFSISGLDIWTASPNQTLIVKGKSKTTPSASLYLLSLDAEWLKDFLLNPHTTVNIPLG